MNIFEAAIAGAVLACAGYIVSKVLHTIDVFESDTRTMGQKFFEFTTLFVTGMLLYIIADVTELNLMYCRFKL